MRRCAPQCQRAALITNLNRLGQETTVSFVHTNVDCVAKCGWLKQPGELAIHHAGTSFPPERQALEQRGAHQAGFPTWELEQLIPELDQGNGSASSHQQTVVLVCVLKE